jgi:hypothetical protein
LEFDNVASGKGFADKIEGKLKDRRFGLRVDDDIEVYVVGGDTLRVVRGRILEHKNGLHLIDEDGHYHRISYDWVTEIIVLKHNRPHPSEDAEYQYEPVEEEVDDESPADPSYS